MHHLTLDILGSPRVFVDGEDVKHLLSQKAIGLIAYLALSKDKYVSRELLASYFWDANDLKTARYNLRHTIWKINQATNDKKLIETTRTTCGLSEAYKIDVDSILLEQAHFEKEMRSIEALEPILKKYRCEFLDGEYYQNASYINEWVLNLRQYCQRLIFELINYIGDYYFNENQFENAQKHHKELLKINPLHEETYAKLMDNRLAANDRVAAINYYNVCAQLLREELNIEPNEKLQDKYEQIMDSVDVKIDKADSPYKNERHLKRRIFISGMSFFDYEFLSRLVEALLIYLDIKMVTKREQEIIYYLKPVFPIIEDYLDEEFSVTLDVKSDIGIYYGLIMLIDCICRIDDFYIEVQEYPQMDIASKKIMNAVEIKMNLVTRGILVKN